MGVLKSYSLKNSSFDLILLKEMGLSLKSSESLNEFEIIRILINAVDEIENYTKEIGSTVLEKPIGFFFSRVIDNRITIQEKYQREYELAVNRAAAFVIQLFFYVIFAKKRVRTRLIESSSLTTIQLQDEISNLSVSKKFSTIFNAQIIKLLPIESIKTLKNIILSMSHFPLGRLQIDILGKIFHGLIPFELRKFLAAFYTSNIASEFLAKIVIDTPKISILDPSCGSGTMLISAYKRLKELDQSLSHIELLDVLYGVDVSTFAAQLAEINLYLQNPNVDSYNSNIKIRDIFECRTDHFSTKKTALKEFKVDLLIGNPPFTRADRLDHEYKNFLEKHLHKNAVNLKYNKKYLGLYGYFLLDSFRFLKEEGILAFVLPLSLIN
ncbi:MAG: HsdM family class I SAM-dependent methyltransferase, partial [Promethearchaeota archaeon]